MSQKFKLSNGVSIDVEDSPFASGGEGDIFKIISPISYANQVLKIYKSDKRTKSKEDKIKFLANNKPNITDINGHYSVIWPVHVAYSNSKFIGFTMHEASGEKLELLCHLKKPKLLNKDWDKFSFNTPGSIEKRLKLCFNISAALSQIYSFGSYVLVDMKPDNVMVKPDGLISIIDIDSVQVAQNNKLLFPAAVATPEYTPSEYYRSIKNIETNIIKETWDRFSIAVIFYRILFGIHPFAGSLKSPFENLTNISDIVEKGFFANGKNKDKFRVIPAPHLLFSKIDKQIQQLFLKTFDDGHTSEWKRSSTDDWCRGFSPDPGIILNRKIPTSSIPCFIVKFSSLTNLPKLPPVNISKPKFIAANKKNVIQKIFSFVNKSAKDELFQKILVQQDLIDNQILELKNITKLSEKETTKFNKFLNNCLEKEKEDCEKLLIKYQKNAFSIDEEAKKYFDLEINEFQKIQKNYLLEINLIDLKLKSDYETIIKQNEEYYINSLNVLKGRLEELIKAETQIIIILDKKLNDELTRIKNNMKLLEAQIMSSIEKPYQDKFKAIELKKNQLNDKRKKLLKEALEKYQENYVNSYLSQYTIESDASNIFTDMYAEPIRLSQNLAQSGFVTAADIKGVNELGQILKSNGSWIKVSEVALTRAKKLDEWRKRKERSMPSTPPQQLPYTEESKVTNLINVEANKIAQEEAVLKKEIIDKKTNMPQDLKKELDRVKVLELQCIEKNNLEKNNFIKHEKPKKDTLQISINKLTTEYNKKQISNKDEFTKISVELNKRKTEHKTKFSDTNNSTKALFDQKHKKLIDNLKKLDHDFIKENDFINSNTRNEIKAQYDLSQKCIDDNSTQIRLKSETVKRECIELDKLQTQYKNN